MAAMLAATSKSLLTSIALVAETVGPSFIILTVVSAAISYFITGSKSFYKSQLQQDLSGQVIAELSFECLIEIQKG
jgi:H+/Cl- antiporter ClcA